MALDAVAIGAQQLRVLDVVLVNDALGDDVINLEDAEGEFAAATVAPVLLLAEQHVLVLAVGNRRVDVGTGRYQPLVERLGHGLMQAHVDQLNGLG